MDESNKRDMSLADLGDGYSTRLATLGDIDSINDLSRRSLGEKYETDYLASRLHQFIPKKNMYCYLCYKDDELVGFNICYALEGGRTLHGLAGRTDPRVRSQGVLKNAGNMGMVRDFIPNHPNWERVRGSSTAVDFYKETLKERVTILGERMIFRCRLSSRVRAKSDLDVNVSPITKGHLNNMMLDGPLRRHLFPKDNIMLDVFTMDATNENVEELVYFNEHILFSGASDISNSALSLGSKLDCNDSRCFRYNFNYFGKIDLELLTHHLKCHIRTAFNDDRFGRETFIIIMAPKVFTEEYDISVLNDKINDIFVSSDGPTWSSDLLYQVAFQYKGYNRDALNRNSKY